MRDDRILLRPSELITVIWRGIGLLRISGPTLVASNGCMREVWRKLRTSPLASLLRRGIFAPPPYISREKAEEGFGIWCLINEQRTARHESSVSASRTEQEAAHPTPNPFRTVAERILARSRRRFLRARFLNSQLDTVDV